MAHPPPPAPHGLGETTGGRLSLGLAPGSTPPSCVTLGQLCDLSESCMLGKSQSPGRPLGPLQRVTVGAARSAFGFRLPPPTAGPPRAAPGGPSEEF